MGQYSGNYVANIYDLGKRYIETRMQYDKPIFEADHNDGQQMWYRQMQQMMISIAGDGSPNNGFKCVGTGASNDFSIFGGNSEYDPGILIRYGNIAYLVNNVDYSSTPSGIGLEQDDKRAIHSKITAAVYSVPNTTFTDSSAKFKTGELVGRNFTPDIEVPANTYAIISNTATEIVVAGDHATSMVNKRYRIEMSTPSGSNRTDGVYLNIYLDEIAASEDGNIYHAGSIEAMRRIRLEHSIFVRQDITSNYEFPMDSAAPYDPIYIDGDGNRHFTIKIAQIARTDGVAAIAPGDVSDLRPAIITGGQSNNPGDVIMTGRASAPTGWLLCDGASYSTVSYPNLFSAIGYQFGGGGGTFSVPNLKGRVPVGVDTSDTDFDVLGETSGAKTSVHDHGVGTLANSSAGGHDHGGNTGFTPGHTFGGSETVASGTVQNHYHPITAELDHTHLISGSVASAGSVNGNVQPSIAMNFIIKY